MALKMMKGNEALAESAIRGGCRFFAGYPITPQSEILEYMSANIEKVGGSFVQSESEVAGVNMIYGATAAGARAMTSSSGPGYSLKQEGISYLAGSFLPAVIVDVQRYGSALGNITPGQSDYWQVVKGGGHGDYKCIVLAPHSVQEVCDIAYESFELAEKYSLPVLILFDGAIGQMAEGVELPPYKEYDMDSRKDALMGHPLGQNKLAIAKSGLAHLQGFDFTKMLQDTMATIEANEERYESYMTDDAELVLVAYGISARICKSVAIEARKKGKKVGLIRPISLYPFPKKAFDELPDSVQKLATVEISSLPQMNEDVQIASKMKWPVEPIVSGFHIPTVAGLLDIIEKM